MRDASDQQPTDEVTQLRHEMKEIRGFMADFLASLDDQVSTKKALELSGIASRTTLIAERQRPGTLLTHSHNGRTVTYGRAGCIAHKRAHQHKARA
ncbi:MAG: hypothetical protein ACRYFX_09845 [Janthinobacterium lividum]